MRRCPRRWLAKRPPTQRTESCSNRYLEEPHYTAATELFAIPPFPMKRVIHNFRYFVRAGKATTGPPIGQDFSRIGLKVIDFTKSFNDRTKSVVRDDVDLIVRIQVYLDKTWQYRIEPPPTAWLLLKAVGLKRRETGPVLSRGHFVAAMTLEMVYEIAKIKQFDWSNPEDPPIEFRVQAIAGQARVMGIAIIGVDTADAPVKGMTPRAYAALIAEERPRHQADLEKVQQKLLEKAPLLERVHRPDLSNLSSAQLQQGIVNSKLFANLWSASESPTRYSLSSKERTAALASVTAHHWLKEDMTLAEARELLVNWRYPIEKRGQLSWWDDE